MINFQDVKTKEDIIRLCNENILGLDSLCKIPNIELGFLSFNNLDKEKEDKLLEVAFLSDKTYKTNYENEMNINAVNAEKINTIMGSIVLLDKCYDDVEALTTEELLTLAYFISNEDINMIEELTKIYNKSVLDIICKKYKSYDQRQKALEVADYLIKKEKIMPTDIEKFIQETDKEKLHELDLERIRSISEYINTNYGVL